MKNLLPYSLILLLFCSALVGCQFIGDIFGAGVYAGVIIVIFIIAIVIFEVSRMFNQK